MFRNGKIAMLHAMRFLDNRQLPSGKNKVDLSNFVLDTIWDHKMAAATKPIDIDTLNTSSSTMTNANNKATYIQTKGSSARSPSWVIIGYVTFCLYACLILIGLKQRLVHFTTDIELEGESSYCRIAKNQKKMEK